MGRIKLVWLGLFCLVLSGCVVRTYKVVRDRVDQDLATGNRGYLTGNLAEDAEWTERKLTRETQVVEIELDFPIKFAKGPKQPKEIKSRVEREIPQEEEIAEEEEEEDIIGNRGYVVSEQRTPVIEDDFEKDFEKYTVQKNDTLQKISQKLYGTTKKWNKIYQMNKDVLSAPDKIYPGQVISVPAVQTENLK